MRSGHISAGRLTGEWQALAKWNGRIFTVDTTVQGAKGEQAVLSYCLQCPRVWESDAKGALSLRVSGWAVSHCNAEVMIRFSDEKQALRWVRPRRSRPDVMKHFREREVLVPEHSGFVTILKFENVYETSTVYAELISGKVNSGQQPFSILEFFLEHRGSLGHDEPFLGLMTPS